MNAEITIKIPVGAGGLAIAETPPIPATIGQGGSATQAPGLPVPSLTGAAMMAGAAGEEALPVPQPLESLMAAARAAPLPTPQESSAMGGMATGEAPVPASLEMLEIMAGSPPLPESTP